MTANPMDKLWFPYLRKDKRNKIRLFCFPHAGGTANLYYSLFEDFNAEVEVLPVQLSGRGTRANEASLDNIKEISRKIADQIVPLTNKPYAFFGHSMGCLLAYEVTLELLKKKSNLPFHLFFSAHRAPDLPLTHFPLHKLNDKELIAELCKYGGTPIEIFSNPEYAKLFLSIIRTDLIASETYLYQGNVPLPVPITALSALNDESVSLNEVLGWKKHSTVSFSFHVFKGGHFYLLNSRKELFFILDQYLNTKL